MRLRMLQKPYPSFQGRRFRLIRISRILGRHRRLHLVRRILYRRRRLYRARRFLSRSPN